MPANYYTATQWRERARRARSTLDQLADPSVRKTLASIASAYDKLAAQAEARHAGRPRSRKSL